MKQEQKDGEDMSDSEDIRVAAQVISLVCPLSQTRLEEPVTAPCKHSFSKKMVINWLRGNNQRQCPVAGMFTWHAMFSDVIF